MEPLSGDWPSYNPQNFSQLRPFDPSAQQPKLMAATYLPTHNRASPPPSQVISTEPKNILLRQLYQKAEEKLRPKRAASDHLIPEHAPKQLRGSS